MSKTKYRIDASIIKSSSDCFRKFYLSGPLGYTSDLQPQAFVFGSAVHVFIENFIQGVDQHVATKKALNYWRETPFEPNRQKAYQDDLYLTMLCAEFAETYESKQPWTDLDLVNGPTSNKPLVEQNFSIPIFEDDLCSIDLCGTIDVIYKIKGDGCYILNDWKTSTSRDKKGFLAEFALSHQLLTYYYAIKWFADDKKFAAARPETSALYQDMIYGANLGATVSPIFMQGKDKPTELKRSEVFFFDKEQVSEYANQLKAFCDQIAHWEYMKQKGLEYIGGSKIDNTFPLPARQGMFTGACTGAWGSMCPYFGLCASKLKGEDAEYYLNNRFIRRDYNPLQFRK